MPEPFPFPMKGQTLESELFTVRMWRERLNDHWEWRGKVQHVATGEVHYFRDWALLIAALQEILSNVSAHN